MPRYFFNTLNGNDEPDDVGVDLDGIKDVRLLAIRFLGELLHDQALAGHPDLDWQLNVTDGVATTTRPGSESLAV